MAKQLKYMRVETAVRDMIDNASPGDLLPTEKELAAQLDCHVLTVRKGLQPFVDRGELIRRVGSGTFVADRASSDRRRRGGHDDYSFFSLMIPNILNPYSDRLVQSLADTALTQNVRLRSAWVNRFGEEALTTARDMAGSGCQAFILPWFPTSMTEEVRNFVKASPVPVVLPTLVPGLEEFCFESADVFGEGQEHEVNVVGTYLLNLGCEKIHFIGPEDFKAPLMQNKITAYASFASRHNLEARFGFFTHDQSSLMEVTRDQERHAGKLGLISYDDSHAARFMSAMHILGLEAPRDYRIIGHNDSNTAATTVPPLTSIRGNYAYLAESMLKTAEAVAKGERFQSSSQGNPQLVVRASCGGRDKVMDMDLPGCDVILEDMQKSALESQKI